MYTTKVNKSQCLVTMTLVFSVSIIFGQIPEYILLNHLEVDLSLPVEESFIT